MTLHRFLPLLLLAACAPSSDPLGPADLAAAAKQLDEAEFMAHVTTLAADDFAGRAPSTPGGRKTVAYLEKAFKALGLQPAFDKGRSYRQRVPLVAQTVINQPPLRLAHGNGGSQTLAYGGEAIVWTSRVAARAELRDSPLVFVGYGVVAPEYGWDDYAGVDMAGKTAVILVNDPGFRNPDGGLFNGRAMTYYGRWVYKYEEAARQGAAGAIVVHETEAAGYPWEVVTGSWSGEQYMLQAADGKAGKVAVEGWITRDAAVELFAQSGLDYAAMVARAGQPSFRPVLLDSAASAQLRNASKQSSSDNVGALLPGSARPEEVFLYTAHWDHLGERQGAAGEDLIYNGAQDNATGTAALLELAQAFTALPRAPQRSVLFLAVTAEESGLLGSEQYANNPPLPMRQHVAGINMDGLGPYGETDDILVVGYGNSQLDDHLRRQAARQGRQVVPEPTPEKGFFYRSDHFNLAKQGVPMLYAEAGTQVRGQPPGYGAAQAEKYIAERYHKPADEVFPGWDNGGILQDLDAFFYIGAEIADSDTWPQWRDGNEFQAIRQQSQQQR